MRAAMFETVTPASPAPALPLVNRQTTSMVGSLGRLALLLPAAVAVLSPFLLLADHLIAEPASRQTLMDRPVSAVQIVLGLALWAALFAWPLKGLVSRFARSREISIDAGMVSVLERSVMGLRHWREPLANYAGVVHVVRSSLSSARHEVLLLHPIRKHSVLLAACDAISDQQVRDLSLMLNQPILPAKALYQLHPLSIGAMQPGAHAVTASR